MYIRELIKEEGLEDLYLSSDESDNEENKQKQKGKRGRPSVPEKWSRVINVHSDDLTSIRTYELASELLLDKNLVPLQSVDKPTEW